MQIPLILWNIVMLNMLENIYPCSGRMEAWQARLRPVGATQDVLDQQSRELKVSFSKNKTKKNLVPRSILIWRQILG